MTTEERLARLERKNRRLTLGLVLTAVAAGVVAAAGAARTGAVPEVVTARKFCLVDENGKARAGLFVFEGGPVFTLLDENDKPRVMLRVNKEGPDLALLDENAKTRAFMALDKDGPALCLSDENGKNRAKLAVIKLGAGLVLLDENGRILRQVVGSAPGK